MPSEDNVLSYPVTLAYGVGHVFNDLCASMWFTYLLIYFNSVLQIDNRLSGAALAIGQLADGISTQIVGLLSDKYADGWRYGRRKSWHLLGTFCVFCTFPFIFSPYFGFQSLSDGEQLIYYSFFIVIFQFGWAATQISHLSLVPDLTPHKHERTGLLTLRYSFTVLSNIAVYVLFWVVLLLTCDKEMKFGPGDKNKFQWVTYIITGFGLLMSALFHVGVKENRENQEDDRSVLVDNTNSSLTSLVCGLRMYNVALIYIATRLFVNLSQIYLPYYLHSYLKLSSKDLATLPLVMFISSFFTSAVIKLFNVAYGRRVTYGIGVIFGIAACVCIYFGQADNINYRAKEIYGVVAVFGCANSILLVTSLGITTDLAGTNSRNGAFIFGFMSLGDKLSNGAAVLLIENLQRVFVCTHYYRNVLIISCSSCALAGLVAVSLLRSDESIERVRIDGSNDSSETVQEEVSD